MPLSFPIYTPYKKDGSLNVSDQLVNEQLVVQGIKVNGTPVENLVATALNVKNNTRQFRTFGNIFASIDIFKGLSYKLSVGGDYDAYVNDYFYPSNIGSYRRPAPRTDANSSQKQQVKFNYLIENTMTYKTSINKHNFNVLAGYTFQKETRDYTYIKGSSFSDNNIKNIAGASSYAVSLIKSNWALESYLSRVQYDYDGKYLLSTAIRADGSSRFGSNNQYSYLFFVSAGWIASKEAFFPKNDILTFAKFTSSWLNRKQSDW